MKILTDQSVSYLVFDVESIGLHGEGYAVGGVILNHELNVVDELYFGCPSHAATGDDEGRKWIEEHVDPVLPVHTHCLPREVRSAFWSVWQTLSQHGCEMLAETIWPVESNFLTQCVKDDWSRQWKGPYPLYDISSILLMAGYSPIDALDRLNNEKPAHNPLCDARQSARLLREAVRLIEGAFP